MILGDRIVGRSAKERIMGTDDRGPKILLGVLILVILIGTGLGGTLMGPGMMGPGMMWGYGNTGGPATAGSWIWGLTMAFGMLMMLAFWGSLIVGAVLLVRWAVGQPPEAEGPTWPEDPAAILRRRYAAGEIDQATYQRMKTELDADDVHTPGEAVGANGTPR
jgi:putative membrane protein